MRMTIRHASFTFEGGAVSRDRAVNIAREALASVARDLVVPEPRVPTGRVDVRTASRTSERDSAVAHRIARGVQDHFVPRQSQD
jgi:hypothetical protein